MRTHGFFAFTGAVTVSKNGGPSLVLMHVDTSIPLWAFFDVYGTTERILIAGTIPPPPPRTSPDPSPLGLLSFKT
jgi:protein neuralized